LEGWAVQFVDTVIVGLVSGNTEGRGTADTVVSMVADPVKRTKRPRPFGVSTRLQFAVPEVRWSPPRRLSSLAIGATSDSGAVPFPWMARE